MIRVVFIAGETIEARDDVLDLTPLGVRRDDRNEAGNKTGEWTLYPWAAIKAVHRLKDYPRGASPTKV